RAPRVRPAPGPSRSNRSRGPRPTRPGPGKGVATASRWTFLDGAATGGPARRPSPWPELLADCRLGQTPVTGLPDDRRPGTSRYSHESPPILRHAGPAPSVELPNRRPATRGILNSVLEAYH